NVGRAAIRAVDAHPGLELVTPSLYGMYDPESAPPEYRDPVLAAIAEGGGSLFVSGIDPGWGNDILPVLISGLASTIDQVRCQEIFDYTTYDQPDSVRYLVGMGTFEKGTQGALRFEVKGIVDGEPRIEVNIEATDEGGNRAAGGNATAVGRLVNSIPWLRSAEPGLYDALQVPPSPGVGKLSRMAKA
ncbi:MAG: hypothetical protein ABIR57_14930, partial [Aeromicrobium sp.]